MRLKKVDKLNIIKLLSVGKSRSSVAKQYNIDISTVAQIKRDFNKAGESALETKTRYNKYDLEFKIKIINEVKNGNGVRRVGLKYSIRHGTILQWLKKFDDFGYNGLVLDQRGRPKMKKNEGISNNNSEKNSTPEEKIKQLEKKIETLKMENDYLKKLDALVQERLKQQRKKK